MYNSIQAIISIIDSNCSLCFDYISKIWWEIMNFLSDPKENQNIQKIYYTVNVSNRRLLKNGLSSVWTKFNQ